MYNCYSCNEDFEYPWYSIWSEITNNEYMEVEYLVPESSLEYENEMFRENLIECGFNDAIIENGEYCPYCGSCLS